MTRPTPDGPLRQDLDDHVAALQRLPVDTAYSDAVHRLLTVVRMQLRMQVAWVSEFVGSAQVLSHVDAEPGADAPAEGTTLPLSGSFCARVLDGRFPRLLPDARSHPEAALLEVTAVLHIGAYVGVPLLGPTGVAVGMLCAVDGDSRADLDDRDVAALQLLAQVLHDLQRRALSTAHVEQERQALHGAVLDVVHGAGRTAVLQPIVDLTTGRAVAAEGLTRFSASSPAEHDHGPRTPAQWFDDASRLGLREQLEIATARSVLDRLGSVPAEVALTVNLGPDTVLGPRLPELLAGRPLPRVVLEITEHAPVADYAGFLSALRPYRDQGLQVAVDDAGAGYASLRHVLAAAPDLVKVDMALTRGADSDPVRRMLLSALSGFARDVGCRLVAEGVETADELRAMADCGIDLVQGYALAPPSESPAWSDYALVPTG